MDIPKIFISDDETRLEERIQYLLTEPKFEPTELLKLHGKLYVAFTHSSKRKAVTERNLDEYLSDKMVRLVDYKHYQETKA